MFRLFVVAIVSRWETHLLRFAADHRRLTSTIAADCLLFVVAIADN